VQVQLDRHREGQLPRGMGFIHIVSQERILVKTCRHPGLRASNGRVSDFAQLWALCLMFRYFSHCPTWRALVSSGAVTVDGTKPTQSPVNQALAASVLADMWESSSRGTQVFGGGRRALPIRKAID